MDCSACRSLFSESFDGRLNAGERRQEFASHLKACPPCSSEFALYQRVFSAVAALPDGEALPFQAPAEVPGAFGISQRSAPPRFARVAAGFLLLLGLAGTHALVFKWSRERAANEGHASHVVESTGPVIAQMDLPGILPSTLRDHVEATDLFIRTAAESAHLPDVSDSRDFCEADYSVSNLARLTSELRNRSYADVPQRHQVERYLLAADNFVRQTRQILDEKRDRSNHVRAICKAAGKSGVDRQLESMRPHVVGLPLGTSFANQPVDACVMKLADDGQMIIMSKRARLAGNLDLAIQGLQQFESKFSQSRLNPLAVYLHADALLAAGQYDEFKRLIKKLPMANPSIARFSVIIQVDGLNANVWEPPRQEMRFQFVDFSTLPMKGECGGFKRLTEDPMPAVVPIPAFVPIPAAAPKTEPRK